ncbi:hypothetical protein HN51_058162, partial [Arachis hypogaea]
MHKDTGGITSNLLGGLSNCLRRCIFGILSMGPVPHHIAFIMDGNRSLIAAPSSFSHRLIVLYFFLSSASS